MVNFQHTKENMADPIVLLEIKGKQKQKRNKKQKIKHYYEKYPMS